jgi:hypothetical protein
MATTNFNSTVGLVGPFGSNNPGSAPVVVAATAGVTGPHAITSGSWNLSVGDTLVVTSSAGAGVTGYGTGTSLVVGGITYAAGTAGTGTVFFTATATGSAGSASVTLNNTSEDTDRIPSFAGNLSGSTNIAIYKKCDGNRLTAGSNFLLFDYTENVTSSGQPSVLVTLDAINDNTGAAISNAVLCLQLADSSGTLTGRVNLATMRAGDSFYASHLGLGYTALGITGVATPKLILTNPTAGTTYYPVYKASFGA